MADELWTICPQQKLTVSIPAAVPAGSTVMGFLTSRITLHTPTDLLAAVPYLLGFHPADSVVIVGLSGARVVFTARADLPPPEAPPDRAVALADQFGETIAGQRVDTALIIGYGPAAAVTRAVFPLRDALRGYGVSIGEMLRVEAGRYWSYLCGSVRCCPAEGTPYDITGTEVAAAATYAGQVALPDRAALERELTPVEGAEREAMERATERAVRELATELGPKAGPVPGADPGRSVKPGRSAEQRGGGDRCRAGLRALALGVHRYAAGDRLTDDEVARLSLLLVHVDLRDLCWSRITVAGDRLDAHLRLWRDVTRRARADLVAAPATLFGYAAWRSGNGALASIAVQRALAASPGYSLALLLGEALDRAIPPSLLDEPAASQSRRRRNRRRSTPTG